MGTMHYSLATAAQFDEMVIQTDIEGAFLEGTSPDILYAYCPRGDKPPIAADGERCIRRVTGNLYGKLDAPRVYGDCYDSHMLTFPEYDSHGNRTVIKPGTADVPTFHFERTYVTGEVRRLDMLVYVDDNMSKFAPDAHSWCLHRDICDHVNQRFKIQKDEHGDRYGWEAKSFLGCCIDRDWAKGTIALSLPAKVHAVLEMVV